MKTNLIYKRKLTIILVICTIAIISSYVKFIIITPKEITLIEGEEQVYKLQRPFLVNIKSDKEGIVKFGDESIGTNSMYLNTEKKGSVTLKMDFMGLIPLKSMKVDVLSNDKIIACGNTVGVKIKIDGILIIGLSDVDTTEGIKVMPTKDSGIKPGDLLVEVNNTKLDSIQDLIDEIDKSNGENMEVKYKRGENYFQTSIQPVKSIDDKTYKIGIWVRESTAGIGTMTFYDPKTNWFGALGHGITDIDTGTLMPVDTGEILQSNILGVRIGKAGNPGELKGIFVEEKSLGTIEKNEDYGIYGKINEKELYETSDNIYSIGIRSNVNLGPATILANINGNNVEEYDVEIQKVSKGSLNGSKGLVVKITDERLLKETGGIVQGMSGSPIIQDNKLIGAITHVLVNDPTRGYGIFIEGMLKNIRENNIDLEKAG